jgi:hypothetical protein
MSTNKYVRGADFGFRPTIEQQKAEAYVREQRPALMELTEGCVLRCGIEVNTFTITLGQQEVFEEPSDYTNKKYIANGGSSQWVRLSDKATTNIRKIIGHPIALQHWLGVIGEHSNKMGDYIWNETELSFVDDNGDIYLTFNLTDGQPSSESDYKSFNDIVSV